MALSSSQITDIIDSTSQKIDASLRKEHTHLKNIGRSTDFSPANQINYLLFNHQTGQPISTLQELNQNWRFITYRESDQQDYFFSKKHLQGNLVLIPNNEEHNAILFGILKIQLQAIATGFETAKQNYSNQTLRNNRNQQVVYIRQRPIQRVYYYGGYHHCYHDDFFRDWLLISLMMDRRGGSGCFPTMPASPHQHGSGSSSSDDGQTCLFILGVLFVCSALIGAAIAVGYAANETYKRADGIFHGEDILGNTLQLTATGVAAWQGALLGFMIATALSISGAGLPVLCGVCSAIIAGAISMKLSGLAVEGMHMLTNKSSAMASDPRFCLSTRQTLSLKSYGYNTSEVNEAIREVALSINKIKPNGLLFWDEKNKEKSNLVTLLRELKKGYTAQYVAINGKSFDLFKPEEQRAHYSEQPPSYDSLYSLQLPNYGTLIQNGTIQAAPQPSAPPAELFKRDNTL